MGEYLSWGAEAIEYIHSRADRYPGGRGVEPEWTLEVLDDEDLLALEPDPKPRWGPRALSASRRQRGGFSP